MVLSHFCLKIHVEIWSKRIYIQYPVLLHTASKWKMQRGDVLMDVRAAHGGAIQVTGQHGAHHALSSAWCSMEGKHQRPVWIRLLQEVRHWLRHNILHQMLTIQIFIKVPLQACVMKEEINSNRWSRDIKIHEVVSQHERNNEHLSKFYT